MSINQTMTFYNKDDKHVELSEVYACASGLTMMGGYLSNKDMDSILDLYPNTKVEINSDGDYIWKPTLVEFYNDLLKSTQDKLDFYQELPSNNHPCDEHKTWFDDEVENLYNYDINMFCGFKSPSILARMSIIGNMIEPYCRYDCIIGSPHQSRPIWREQYEVTISIN